MIYDSICHVMRGHFIFAGAIFLFLTAASGYSVFKISVGYGVEKEPEERKEVQRIKARLSREKDRLRAFRQRERALLEELSTMEKDVAEKRAVLTRMKKKARLNVAELARLKANREQLTRTAEDIEHRLSNRLVGLYKYARKGYLKALVDVRDIVQFWRRVEYLARVMGRERNALVELAAERRSNVADMSAMTSRLNEMNEAIKAENARFSTLNGELEQKVLRLTNIHREKEFLMTTVRDLQRASENVRQTLVNFEDHKKIEVISQGAFIEQKGLLPLPMEGKIVEPMIHKGADNGLYDGVFIEGPPGAAVKAVFPGRIAFSGEVKGYGNLIIVAHGSRFYTISAHLSKRMKSEGNTVRKGEVLGTVGGKKSTAPGRLYFEVRKGANPLNPVKWLRAG